MMDSRLYWDERYRQGGTSGAGSRGDAASFKAGVVNSLIERFEVQTVLDLGCGDGYLARLIQVPRYWGMDVSPTAVRTCSQNFADDETKSFSLLHDFADVPECDMALSMDVVLHLVEDPVFERYVELVFASSRNVVVFYSTDHDDNRDSSPHVRHRKLTDWVSLHMAGWELDQVIESPIPDDISAADFYIYVPV